MLIISSWEQRLYESLRMSTEICRLGEGHNLCRLECRISVWKLFPWRPRKCCRLKTQSMLMMSSSVKGGKEEIWLSPTIKAPTPTEKSKTQRDNTKNATKNFDYTTITDRLRTVSWSNNSHPTGVVKTVYERSTFPLTATAMKSKGHIFKEL